MGQRQRKWGVSLKKMDGVGVGGHHSGGHSEDVGVTPQGLRSGQRSLHSKKEQLNSAAAQQRKRLR